MFGRRPGPTISPSGFFASALRKSLVKNTLSHFVPPLLIKFRSYWPLIAVCFLATLGSYDSLPAQTPASMPREITERLWLDPGPAQNGANAPKLLLIYPKPSTKLPASQRLTRYSGRVEPADAKVMLDGKKITVFPGGVFTGVLSIPEGKRKAAFSAESGGRKTTIKRTIFREREREGLKKSPLRFHPTSPFSPGGAQEYWLRPGSRMRVGLRASPENSAYVRLGEEGAWAPMEEKRSGYYEGTIGAEDAKIEALQAVKFKLTTPAGRKGRMKSIERASRIKLKRLPPNASLLGQVDQDFATFLKKETGWSRWGNWYEGTPFSVIEKRGDRLAIQFESGEPGYIEANAARLKESLEDYERVDLGEGKITFEGASPTNRVSVDWAIPHPIAHVISVEEVDEGSSLRFSALGASAAAPIDLASPEDDALIRGIRISAATPTSPPEVRVDLGKSRLWGYGLSQPDASTVRLTVRAQPVIDHATTDVPLLGLRVMIDAGHGGTDDGAIGPSGITEADVNLVVAAHLGDRLEELGAVVRQVRVQHSYVSLDDRIRMAVDWQPDMFISIHHNSVPFDIHPLKDRGPKVFYHYPHAVPLAAAVAEELNALLTPDKKPIVKGQVFRVNRNISFCPSILVEGAFVSNPRDDFELRQTENLRAMAHSIARGVVNLMAPPEVADLAQGS